MDIQKYESVVKKYTRFFVFAFKYFFIFLAVIICFLIFQKVFLRPVTVWQQDDPFILQRVKLVTSFEKFLSQAVHDHDIEIFILQGPLLTENNFIISQDNLITYKGFVVPKNLAISATLPLKEFAYFQNDGYAVDELANFVNNLVLTTQSNSSKAFQNTQIPLNDTLVNTFNLNCLLETTIYPKTCDHYIQNFLSSFFVYRLGDDYMGLQKIFSAIQKKKNYREDFCDNMKKYLLYTNDTDPQLGDIFDTCGLEYKDFFRTMESFIDVQNQLQAKLITTDTYKEPNINVYKLLSYQQILYQDFQDFTIRTNQYTLYLEYIQELIRRNAVPQIYLDEIYRYNTYYLNPTLLTARYDRRFSGIKESDINNIIKNLETINAGTSIGGYSGLTLLVSNPALVVQIPETVTAEVISLQEKIAKRIASISYLTIAQVTTTDNKISIKGYFLVNDQKVAVELGLLYDDDTFRVTYVSLANYPEFTTSLLGLIQSRKTTIGELYASISKDLALYETTSPIKDLASMCADIRTLEPLLGIEIHTCTNDVLVAISQDIEPVTYTFFLQNFVPTNISVSDEMRQKEIQQTVNTIDINTQSLKQIVQNIVNAPSITAIQHEGTINTVAALERMQQFLNITPNDIAESTNKILVDFTVRGINFIAYYDRDTYVLGPRYLKDILINDKPLLIGNMQLTLTRDNQETIDVFLKDPLSYIKTIDLTAWKNYTEKMK